MYELPDKYNLDYMIYSNSNSVKEQEELLSLPYIALFKRTMFTKYDKWVEQRYSESKKDGE